MRVTLNAAAKVAVALLFVFRAVPCAWAQLDEARGANWDNAKKLYFLIVDASNAAKRDEAYKATGEFRLNLDLIEGKLNRVGQRLHEKDRAWLGSKRQDVRDQLARTRLKAGLLGTAIQQGSGSYDSELRDFKSEWEKFANMFDRLWVEMNEHGRELNDIVKAFREECRGCS